MRTELEVEGKMVKVVIDTGAAASVITSTLRKSLNVPIEGSSRFSYVMANGNKVGSLGKTVVNVWIDEELTLPVEVDIIESTQEELILGNSIMKQMKANINFERKTLEIEDSIGVIEIPMEYEVPRIVKQIQEDEETDYDSFEEDSEYEKNENRNLYTYVESDEENLN